MNPELDMLVLDERRIDPDALPIRALMRELNLREQPAPVLRTMMRALDKKRQARGLGWSRPWNKIGMTIFRTHRHIRGHDGECLRAAMAVMREFAPEPLLTRPFIDDLAGDPARMAFTFYHDRTAGRTQYEGLTVSLGRPVPHDRTKYDRLDLILEDRRVDGRVDGIVDLVRIIVCPWDAYGVDRDHQRHEQCEFSEGERARFDAVYAECLRSYREWRDDASRQWSHWSAAYIDYFGTRTFVPTDTSFP